jgi:hypothetical protein
MNTASLMPVLVAVGAENANGFNGVVWHVA